MKGLLDIATGYKTYVIGGAMFLHGASQIVMNLLAGVPIDTFVIVETLSGLGLVTGRRATAR